MSMSEAVAQAEVRRGRGRPRKISDSPEPQGRKDKTGQEAVINNTALTDAMPGLVSSMRGARDANKKHNKAIQNTAKKSGYLAAIVRRLVADADEKERLIEGRRKVTQAFHAYEAYANAIQLDLLPDPEGDDASESDAAADAERTEGEGGVAPQ